jgi:hypothetical protein
MVVKDEGVQKRCMVLLVYSIDGRQVLTQYVLPSVGHKQKCK